MAKFFKDETLPLLLAELGSRYEAAEEFTEASTEQVLAPSPREGNQGRCADQRLARGVDRAGRGSEPVCGDGGFRERAGR